MMRPFEWALLAAMALAGLEVVSGTFVLLGFGLGCVAVALAELAGGGAGWSAAAFVVVSGAAIVALRRVFGRAGDSVRAEGDVNRY